MSEIKKERGTEEILIYALLNEVRYTKQDVDLDVIMGEIIHIMENKKKIKKKIIKTPSIPKLNKTSIQEVESEISKPLKVSSKSSE